MKAAQQATVKAFKKAPIQFGKLRVPIAKPLSQLCLQGLLLSRKLDIGGINVTENGKQQLIGYIL